MSKAKSSSAWIGLGGNLGAVREAMAYALQQFDHRADCCLLAVSSIYKTPPWGKTDQPWFLNACAKLTTTLEPEILLQLCLDIEKRMKRRRTEKWGPRTLDIDLLFYENLKISIPGQLVLPHPQMAERAFVLVPLAEISPDLLLDGQTVASRAEEKRDERIIKFPVENLWWKARLLGQADAMETKNL